MRGGDFTESLQVGESKGKARFFKPYLNRWSQPDTIVPNLYNPQTLNRYSYVNNNPVRFTDPTGHCPKPTQDVFDSSAGPIICFAAFIPVEFSTVVPDTIYYTGDNRDFSSNSDSSRIWIWIDGSSGEILDFEIHETCRTNGQFEVVSCAGPRDVQSDQATVFQNWLIAQQTDEGIVVDFGIICDDKLFHDAICAFTFNGIATFVQNQPGKIEIDLDLNNFPNYEAYLWDTADSVTTLFNIQNFSQDQLDSSIGTPPHPVFGSISSKRYHYSIDLNKKYLPV